MVLWVGQCPYLSTVPGVSFISMALPEAFGREQEMVQGYHRWCCVELGSALGGTRRHPCACQPSTPNIPEVEAEVQGQPQPWIHGEFEAKMV